MLPLPRRYTVLLVHGHWMQSGDLTLADENFDQLVNNTMFPFVDPATDLVNFTGHGVSQMGPCPLGGAICNSPMCHNDTAQFPPGVGSRSCDNIDWLPKFRAGFKFTATNRCGGVSHMAGWVLCRLSCCAWHPGRGCLLLPPRLTRRRAD